MAVANVNANGLYTLKTNSASVAFNSEARQEYYQETTQDPYNYVGIINLRGLMSYSFNNQNITQIKLTFTTTAIGSNHDKTLYLCKSLIQNGDDTNNKKGSDYVGTALGTVTVRNSGTTPAITLDKDHSANLFNSIAAYIKAGNNVLILYNPSATGDMYASVTALSMEVTYSDSSERASQPTITDGSGTELTNVALGSEVTIELNPIDETYKHEIRYRMNNTNYTIAQRAGSSYTWTVPDEEQAEPGTSVQIFVFTYESDGTTLVSNTSKATYITLVAPISKPHIVSVVDEEGATSPSGMWSRFGFYIKTKSRIRFTVTIEHTKDLSKLSNLSNLSITIDGSTYETNIFDKSGGQAVSVITTNAIMTSGTHRVVIVCTDDDGNEDSIAENISVVDYVSPSINGYECVKAYDNGVWRARLNFIGKITPLDNLNTRTLALYAKETGSEEDYHLYNTITTSDYEISISNQIIYGLFTLEGTKEYDFKIVLSDFFGPIERTGYYEYREPIIKFPHEESANVEIFRGLEYVGKLVIEIGDTPPVSLAPGHIYLQY